MSSLIVAMVKHRTPAERAERETRLLEQLPTPVQTPGRWGSLERLVLNDLRAVHFDSGPPWNQVRDRIRREHGISDESREITDRLLDGTDELLEVYKIPADNVQTILKNVRGANQLDTLLIGLHDHRRRHRYAGGDELGAEALHILRLLRRGKTLGEKMGEHKDAITTAVGVSLVGIAGLLALELGMARINEWKEEQIKEHTRPPAVERVEKPTTRKEVETAKPRTGEEKHAAERMEEKQTEGKKGVEEEGSRGEGEKATETPIFEERLKKIRKNPKNIDNYSLLLTNSEFGFNGQMTSQEIQDFFEHTPYGNKTPLAEHTEGDKTAAEMIYDAAKEADVNPQLIMARLQVEQGLISRTAAVGEHSLDWALGVGATDKGRIEEYRGFGNQVAGAAQTLRRLYDEYEPGDEDHSTVGINYGDDTIKPENAATYALFRYTPHTIDTELGKTGGGNYLFMNVWNRFGFDER